MSRFYGFHSEPPTVTRIQTDPPLLAYVTQQGKRTTLVVSSSSSSTIESGQAFSSNTKIRVTFETTDRRALNDRQYKTK